jgi:hypothetical protein
MFNREPRFAKKGRPVKMDWLMKRVLFLSGPVLTLALSGCLSEPSSDAKRPEKAAEPVTGQLALYRMYQVARSWAPDVEVLAMHSIHVTEVPDVVGSAGAWQATFISEMKNATRSYTYSVIEADPNLHLGVFAGQPESSTNGLTTPFLIATVKVDTNAAYKTALAKTSEAANEQKTHTISFLLDKQEKFTNPSWRVVWGESVGTAGLSAYIDASTGEYLATMH